MATFCWLYCGNHASCTLLVPTHVCIALYRDGHNVVMRMVQINLADISSTSTKPREAAIRDKLKDYINIPEKDLACVKSMRHGGRNTALIHAEWQLERGRPSLYHVYEDENRVVGLLHTVARDATKPPYVSLKFKSGWGVSIVLVEEKVPQVRVAVGQMLAHSKERWCCSLLMGCGCTHRMLLPAATYWSASALRPNHSKELW